MFVEGTRIAAPPLLHEFFRMRRNDNEKVGSAFLTGEGNIGIFGRLGYSAQHEFAHIVRHAGDQGANRNLPCGQ